MKRKIIFTLLISIAVICLVNSVCAHEAEYPEPHINNPKINSVVSGDVDFDISVDDHHETLYVNVTATHMQSNKVYFHTQDNNPTDGWSCRWDTSDAPNGKYYVSAVAMNSKNLKGQYNILITLNNTKKETNIVLDSSVGVVDKPNTIMAHLYGANSTPLTNKELEFTVDGQTIKATATDGVALATFTPKEAKVYNITAKFAGDNVYAPSQAIMTLNVVANSTTITVEDIRGNNKDWILLKANLKNYMGLNANRQIDFYINGNKVGSALSDENGDASFNYTIDEVGGTHIYSAEFRDSETNETFKGISSLYVPESSLYTKISATTYSKDGIFTVGNNVKVTYAVFNDGPDSAENVKFSYVIPDSLKYISAAATQGNFSYNSKSKEFSWDLGNVSIGNQTLTIEFTASKANKNNLAPIISTSTYDKSVVNNITRNTLIVSSYKLDCSDLTKYYTGTQKYRIYLKDENSKGVSGATITVTFMKQTFVLKTNKNGYIEFDTKDLNVGKYSIKATCNGLSKTKNIVVKPLLVTKDLTQKKSKTTKFSAKLLNNKGKVVSGKKVTFKLNGKTLTGKTNAKGIATVSFTNLKVGKHTVTVSYGKSVVKNKITIKK